MSSLAALRETHACPASTVLRKRRPKLWDLHGALHCPIIGTCLDVAVLRRIARNLGLSGRLSDYEIHVNFVAAAGTRNALSLAAQKALDRIHAGHLRRFARAGSTEQLAEFWERALAEGDVPGAFWATLTHPSCDDALQDRAREEVHMLSHQIGAGQRADLKRLAETTAELNKLRSEMADQRQRSGRMIEAREQRIVELEAGLAGSERRRQQSLAEAQELHRRLEAMGGPSAAERLSKVEQRARAAQRRVDLLEQELASSRQACVAAGEQVAALEAECRAWQARCTSLEEILAQPAGDYNACEQTGACTDLRGRRILCVGGRGQLVDHYRDLVTRCNGRFEHYDGGIEDNRQRLETLLASADAVVCATDCVSHDAYQRCKRFCKRFARPCVLLRSSGVSSFARALEDVAGWLCPDTSTATRPDMPVSRRGETSAPRSLLP
ncbi:DUF2325 domain-containing protein [Thioalkalivibrio sulfidiphilus]|uniref:DUF2325 domain-containing protein n=1 Tax=Thioalkalivibrio sulfidiphilus TaxID=1033854 RepID=UPI003B29A106